MQRVMVVDDDALLRSIAASTLRHAGFDVVEADCGETALSLFDQTSCNLILLDVMMPGMDGYEACVRIRQRDGGAALPILMLTGLNDTESIERAFESGATDFISKPINWTLLAQRVRYSLRAGEAMVRSIRDRQRLERAHRVANMGSWELQDKGTRLVCSSELKQLLGQRSETAWPDTPEMFLERVCAEDRERVHNARAKAALAGKAYQLTFRIERFDGALRTVFEQTAVSGGPDRGFLVEGITQDISDRVEAERRIVELANCDALTGLSNRRYFDELAARALARSARLGTSCALVHVDIDRFKSVNDALGHAAGDEVLRTISSRLQASIRSFDLAAVGGRAGDAVLARVGGNAFTLLLLDVKGDQQIAPVAGRLQRVISEAVEVNGREVILSASIGIAFYPRDSASAAGLSRCAEQAAYAAKAAGRAQFRCFDEELNARASERLANEAALRHAISNAQLRLHYQPKIDTRDGSVIGAEALVRWQHPDRGLVAPGEFIPLAEETGLIVPLTDWVLETSCADLRRRAESGMRQVPVSVNFASSSFLQDGLLSQLESLMVRYGLEPSCLVIEVTESMLMADVEGAAAKLAQLRERGFSVSLDDFGTGYSSLSYLKRFPIDELKIDRSFVTDVCRGPRDGDLAASIIALAKAFGLRVVAEGVETTAQANFLSERGCRLHQGFLYARPMPSEEFDLLLAASPVERSAALTVVRNQEGAVTLASAP